MASVTGQSSWTTLLTGDFSAPSASRPMKGDPPASPAGAHKEMGLVSIIIPIHNAEHFLREAIASVQAQCYTHWELILVDDGSTDQSVAIAQQQALQEPKHICFLPTRDGVCSGTNAARNRGLRQARGDYVLFLDADDVLTPNALSRQVALLAAHPEAEVVCGALQYWYSWTGDRRDRQRDFLVSLQLPSERTYAPPDLLCYNLQARGRKPGMGSFLLRRTVLEKIGAFPEMAGALTEDQVLWARICLQSPIYITGHCFLQYRQHPASMCAQAIREGTEFAANHLFLAWLSQHLVAEQITDPVLWKAWRGFQRSVRFQHRWHWVKRLYRYCLPLRVRYRLRDGWTHRYSMGASKPAN